MNFLLPLVFAILAVIFLKRLLQPPVPEELVKNFLERGGVVIDVRSPGEYAAGHLDNVPNHPLDTLANSVPAKYPDRETALLLHCLSGGRSGQGVRILHQLGYKHVLNLGSFRHAKALLAKLGAHQ